MQNKQALVLGGGGFVASSWITGLITGMAEAGADVRHADMLIGTSSGARVALQLASGAPLEEIFARQISAAPQVGRQSSALNWQQLQRDVAQAKALGGERAEILRRMGTLALALGGPDRQALLPMDRWPDLKTPGGERPAPGSRPPWSQQPGLRYVSGSTAAPSWLLPCFGTS